MLETAAVIHMFSLNCSQL